MEALFCFETSGTNYTVTRLGIQEERCPQMLKHRM